MRRYDGRDAAQRTSGLTDAIASAKRGDLVLANADGAYVVLTDAFSTRGVRLVREFKQRPDMNLPILVGRPETFDGIAMTSGGGALASRELVKSCWPGALTLIANTQPMLAWDCTPSKVVAVRMPLHPWTLELVRAIGPTAAVPAHDHDAEPLTSVDAVEQRLGEAVSVVLDGGPCLPDQMSSVVDVSGSEPRMVREGAFTFDYLQRLVPALERQLVD